MEDQPKQENPHIGDTVIIEIEGSGNRYRFTFTSKLETVADLAGALYAILRRIDEGGLKL